MWGFVLVGVVGLVVGGFVQVWVVYVGVVGWLYVQWWWCGVLGGWEMVIGVVGVVEWVVVVVIDEVYCDVVIVDLRVIWGVQWLWWVVGYGVVGLKICCFEYWGQFGDNLQLLLWSGCWMVKE